MSRNYAIIRAHVAHYALMHIIILHALQKEQQMAIKIFCS